MFYYFFNYFSSYLLFCSLSRIPFRSLLEFLAPFFASQYFCICFCFCFDPAPWVKERYTSPTRCSLTHRYISLSLNFLPCFYGLWCPLPSTVFCQSYRPWSFFASVFLFPCCVFFLMVVSMFLTSFLNIFFLLFFFGKIPPFVQSSVSVLSNSKH